MTDNEESSYLRLYRILRQFLTLKTEEVKLTLSEKLTILISMVAVAAILALVGGLVMLLVTFAAANWIAETLGMTWALLIVAGFYLVLMLLIVLFRKAMIINPVSRFITRLLLQ